MTLPFAARTSTNVAKIALKARDGQALSDYYRELLGLHELTRSGTEIRLGAGDRHLLTIEEDRALQPDDPRSAGLFHTAFLFPERADLARWTHRAIERKIAIDGASDHLVSEAIYLTDPEGNGIEIYADRLAESWTKEGNQVVMKTLPLDFHNLLGVPGGSEPYVNAPDDTVIGHVHLRVGNAAAAEQWWQENFGLDTMARYGPSAVFLASDGYHHHIGANSWNSAGAGKRDEGRSGLSSITMNVPSERAGQTLEDPWGTVVHTIGG